MFLRHALTIGALGFLLAGAPAVAQTGTASGRIPAEERVALVALFASANGDGWSSAEGWTREDGALNPWGTECEWEGIECDDDDAHIVEIRLSHNNLSGTLPARLIRLKHLMVLHLNGNELSGPIPAGLLALPQLEELYLEGNALTGAVAIGGPRCRLETLNIANNHLTGPLPASLARCDRLRHLDLSGNALSSTLPPQIGGLRMLETLVLGSNAFEGTLPSTWRGLAVLERIDLSHNQLSGGLGEVLGSIKSLTTVDVSYNKFAGTLHGITSLANLRFFAAASNQLTGSIPPALGTLPLRSLELSRNTLTGPLPQSFESLDDLVDLDLASNRLLGPLLRFDQMESLTTLVLASNAFDADVSGLELPASMEYLDLSSNRLHGVLPTEFFAGRLRYASIAENRIEGPLPASLWESATLKMLNASRNRISGPLPGEIQDLAELRELDLSHNALSGSIPEALLSLPALVAIDLSQNQLTGELPQAGGRGLQKLELSVNRIVGAVPAWIGGLPALRFVGLRGNLLTGGLDTLAGSRTLRAAALAENPWQTSIPPKLASIKAALDPRFPLLDAEVLSPPPPPPSPPPPPPPPPIDKLPTGEQRATISGSVRDNAGGVIPGVVITAQSPSGARITSTDESGLFSLAVPPGTYQLTAELAGFRSQSQVVTASPGAASSINLTFHVAGVEEEVTVAAGGRSGPWWNTWMTRRGAPESSAQPTLTPNTDHTFYLELSAAHRALSGGAVRSTSVDRAFLQRLRQLATHDQEGVPEPVVNDEHLEPMLTFRFLVIGRAARLLPSRNNVAAWQDGRWQAVAESTSATVTVRLAALFAGETEPREVSEIASRAAALRVGIRTGQPGCAAVAVSVWDETGRVPMDSTVYYLEVGGAGQCDRAAAIKQASVNMLKAPEERDIQADVALHSFELALNGVTTTASFMVLRQPARDCGSYSWSSDATASGLVLDNTAFKSLLKEARQTDGIYARVAQLLQSAVFPPSRGPCASDAAWAALQKVAREGHTRVFARFEDRNGQLQAVPLGLLAMLENERAPLFPNDFTVIEPLARETLDETSCVSAWTFVLPTELDGLGPVPLPPWAADDKRVLRSRTDFESRFLSASDTSDPLGLLLLAHHEQGVLTFSAVGDTLSFPDFKRRFGDGSIAVLSACETANLVDNGRLITRLNENGVDALVTSPFVVDPTFGATFAANFATVIHDLDREASVEELFRRALTRTAEELEHSRGPRRARGMTLELVLAGNPRLKICPQPSGANKPSAMSRVATWRGHP